MAKRANQTLCGVEYWYTSGTMMGADIHIKLTDEEIVYASYFPWEGMNDYSGDETDCITVEHESIEIERWNEIQNAVMEIVPLLEPEKKAKESKFKKILDGWFNKNIEVLDGGDSYGFVLTWRDETGEEISVGYYIPNDSRFHTLLELMKETVHPIGRINVHE